VTAVLLVPVTLAVKACVASRKTVTELGDTVTLTDPGPVGTPPPPQALRTHRAHIEAAVVTTSGILANAFDLMTHLSNNSPLRTVRDIKFRGFYL
jgi:hypothetical protein